MDLAGNWSAGNLSSAREFFRETVVASGDLVERTNYTEADWGIRKNRCKMRVKNCSCLIGSKKITRFALFGVFGVLALRILFMLHYGQSCLMEIHVESKEFFLSLYVNPRIESYKAIKNT